MTEEAVHQWRRQFIKGGDSIHQGRRQFIKLRDHSLMGYQSSREDTGCSGRKPFTEGGNPLREEVICQERGTFINVGKRPFVKGGYSLPNTWEEPFIRRGGCLSREGDGHSSWEGEGLALWYELDLSWV